MLLAAAIPGAVIFGLTVAAGITIWAIWYMEKGPGSGKGGK